jgi:Ca2+-binding RTX toxin-like protein
MTSKIAPIKVEYHDPDDFEVGIFGGVWLGSRGTVTYEIMFPSAAAFEQGQAELQRRLLNTPKPSLDTLVVRDKEGKLISTLSGLSINLNDFEAGLGIDTANEGKIQVSYPSLVSLLDGKVQVIGSGGDDRFLEIGAGGKATVKSGKGFDKLFVWHTKKIDFDGGKDLDTILFTSNYGDPYPTPFKQQLVINLDKGTGKSPYGGSLKLKNVENVVGTSQADKITGSNKANVIGDGAFDTGADRIKAKGGDDIVKIASLSTGGVRADGGKGKDELQFTVDSATTTVGTTVIDIDNPGNNTGRMSGNVLKGFEVFTASSLSGFADHLDFRGSNADETVTGVAGFLFGPAGVAGADMLNGRGGDDTLDGKVGNDRLTGGSGKDTLLFTTVLGATTNADTIVDFQPGADTLGLNAFIFAAAGGVGGLAASKFGTLSGQDANDAILYEQATGRVFYDPDGPGGTAPILFVTLLNKATLKASDIELV